VEKCCHFFDLFRLITGREASLSQVRAIAQRGVNYEDEPALYDVPIIDSAYVLIPMDPGAEQQTRPKPNILGCLELCMYAEGSRHQEEVIVTGTLGRLEAYLPENKVYSFRRPTHELWSDRSVPPPKSAVRQEVYDCSSVKEVFGIESDIPTHSGYHYSSTAVEWHELLGAIRKHQTTGVWEPRVSVLDGLRAVELGLCATEAIVNETT
jgi:myo-inositol 2-dehydrogenase / D-chiro-inositol 1-dehydrogenase